MQADILSLRGAIWRHSRLQILRKPILAFIFPFVDLGKRNWKGLESALQFQLSFSLAESASGARIVHYSRRALFSRTAQ